MTKNSRILWIDVARALTMFCVVIGHTLPVGNINTVLYGFHVPAFFFLSGIFFSSDEPFKKFLTKRFCNIMIPYLFFGLIAICAYLLFGNLIYAKDLRSFGDCLYGLFMGSVKTGCMHFNYHLWFLPALFSMNLILYPFSKLIHYISVKRNVSLKYLYLLLSVFFLIVSQLIFTFKATSFLPLGADTALRLIPFFVAGKTASYFDAFLSPIHKDVRTCSVFAVLAVISFALSACFSKVNSLVTPDFFHPNYMRDTYGNRFLLLLSAVFGIVFIVLFSKLLPASKPIVYTGRKSLCILVMQKFPIMIFNSVIPFTAQLIRSSNLPVCVILSVLTIVLCLVANSFFEKLLPFVYGKKYK